MSVYVDDMEAAFGRMKMCHMIADTPQELLAMVDRIGVQRKWIQDAGTRPGEMPSNSWGLAAPQGVPGPHSQPGTLKGLP